MHRVAPTTANGQRAPAFDTDQWQEAREVTNKRSGAALSTYLRGSWLVGRAALQVCQDAGEGVDLSIQTGASLLQRLLRSFNLSANITHTHTRTQWANETKTVRTDHFSRPPSWSNLLRRRLRLLGSRFTLTSNSVLEASWREISRGVLCERRLFKNTLHYSPPASRCTWSYSISCFMHYSSQHIRQHFKQKGSII